MIDLNSATESITKLIRPLGQNVYNNVNQMVIAKEYDHGADVSTNFDQELERAIFEFVEKNYPNTGFQGEENPELTKQAEYMWFVDPIDGTKWFKNNVPLWCISIALVRKEDRSPVLGIIYNPSADQMYSAYLDGGAYLNGKKLAITAEADPLKVQLALDLTSHRYDWEQHKNFLSQSVIQLIQKYYRVRMIGSGALSLAWLAQGMFGAFVNPYRHESELLDTAAGMILATEAGAKIWKKDIGKELEQMVIGNQHMLDTIVPLIELNT
ncbi:inositol monophosphatase family protein [Candidatus Dojkabacteria bacterium]|uniref:Inositol monophosphatase family protein n=1 Tax=Candidatus Dojkabacteria bacterium TaxID=2099670 RepID=A0A955L4K9_9BACT|nr:inositol monophosphatase family protein [Candidatus Dojkabacteria bacterium]